MHLSALLESSINGSSGSPCDGSAKVDVRRAAGETLSGASRPGPDVFSIGRLCRALAVPQLPERLFQQIDVVEPLVRGQLQTEVARMWLECSSSLRRFSR